MEIVWSKFAERQLYEIYLYYNQVASEETAVKLFRALLLEPNRLLANPYIGQLEPRLRKRGYSYRYLIFRNHKIIYSIDSNKGLIKIADVFDTRSDPDKMERIK